MQKKPNKLFSFLVLLSTCFVSATSVGTTLLALTLEDLTFESDYIVTGNVIDSTGFLEDGRIHTLHRIEVNESVDNSLNKGDVIEMVTAGGHSEWFSQKVFGAPELEVGQEYLLFLRQHRTHDIVRAVGMSQGAYRLIRDPASQSVHVSPSCTKARLVQRYNGQSSPLQETAPWLTVERSLDEVIDEIRAIKGNVR